MPLNKRKVTAELASQVKEQVQDEPIIVETKKVQWDKVQIVSTGSTLLDLAISGGRNYEGGIPGGIILEVSGPAGSGKTAVLAAIAASAQSKNGQVMFLDPEARFDKQYAEIYGIKLNAEDYHRPNTVEEVFEKINNWKPVDESVPNVIVTDSLAALSTEMEMDDKDAYGMRRAKCFSEGFRKTARIISNNNWIIACSNQQRDGQYGAITPGGQAIKYYCSLRISMKQSKKITKEKDFHGRKVSKELGIESECQVIKNSLGDPYGKCIVSIVFQKGIDTVRDELAFFKTSMGETSYNCIDKNYQSLDKAVEYIEQNGLQLKLKERTIQLWNEIENLFKGK